MKLFPACKFQVDSAKSRLPLTQETTPKCALHPPTAAHAEKQPGRKDAHQKPLLPDLTGS